MSVQWTIIFGNDEKALKKASIYLRRHPLEGVRLLGFTKEIDVYFSASNVVITKPGGLTTCEVVSTGIPLVLCAPIPGQEEGNARLLCETGAAVRQDDPAELVTEVLQLLKNDTQMKALKKAAKQMIPGKSAQRITAAVVAFLDGSPSDRRKIFWRGRWMKRRRTQNGSSPRIRRFCSRQNETLLMRQP